MIRINLAKAAGKKGLGGGPSASFLIILLFIAAVGGAYYYFVHLGSDEDGESPLVALMSYVNSVASGFGAREPSSAPEVSVPVPPGTEGDPADAPEEVVAAVSVPASEPEPAAVPEKPVAAVPEPEPKPDKAIAAALETPPAPIAPSSMVRTNMAENVVKELPNDAGAVRRMNVAYEDMIAAEKINYEVLFGRNAFELVTRCSPPGIMLRSLEIENFQTVYASGVGSTREMVQEMFASFKGSRGELLPRPYSHIKDDEKGGYLFAITYKPRFGSDFGDPFQAFDHIGFRGAIAGHMKKFTRLAGENNIKFTAAPRQISVVNTGNYRRVIFAMSGTTTYKDFHKFVLDLYGERVPCAFKTVKIKPLKDETVRVNAEILFTVKQ